jgi:hypothetical protein
MQPGDHTPNYTSLTDVTAGRGISTHLIIFDTPFQRRNGALSLYAKT